MRHARMSKLVSNRLCQFGLVLGSFAIAWGSPANAQVTTAQYGNARTGATLSETVLTPQNVNAERFGKLLSLPVDGDVYAQPLYVPQVQVPHIGMRNIVFIATEHDSVYAFDADAGSPTPLWHVSFLSRDKEVITVPPIDLSCPFIRPEVGITSTPVIDSKSGTIYVLARTKERKDYVQRLHALDIATGAEKYGGPVIIAASVERGEPGGTQGHVNFDPLRQNPRAALLLADEKVYLTWASSCDVNPYHGWLMAYDEVTLKQTAVFNTSPDGSESGIWQGDAGPAADDQGNVYIVTGNGSSDAGNGGRDFGNSVVKLASGNSGFVVRDFFMPFNQQKLSADDLDLGSSGPLLVPDQVGSHPHLLIVAGKGEGIYVIDRDHMGKYRGDNNSHAVQNVGGIRDCFGAPAYWNQHIYYVCEDDSLKDFRLDKDLLSPSPAHSSEGRFTGVGATPTVSANGAEDAIVWVVATPRFFAKDGPAVLHAYSAADVTHELYNSSQNPGRDSAGEALRFAMPTVVNGRVYLGVKNEVDVYGLLTAI